MRHPTSLTLRLTLLFSAVATVVLLAFGWIIERSIEEHFAAEDVKELKVIAQAVERSLSTLQPNHDLTRIQQRFDDILVGHHRPLLYISDASGKVLYSSPGPDLSLMPPPSPDQFLQGGIQQWSDSKHHYRVLIQQMAGKRYGPYTVFVAVAIDFHLHFLKNFHYTLWLVIICGIIIMGLMSWIAVRVAMS